MILSCFFFKFKASNEMCKPWLNPGRMNFLGKIGICFYVNKCC